MVWFTPHTMLMSASEVRAMGGAQHPVIGNYGVMSAKNGAINVMMCLTALSYIFYRRANRTITVSWAPLGMSFSGLSLAWESSISFGYRCMVSICPQVCASDYRRLKP